MATDIDRAPNCVVRHQRTRQNPLQEKEREDVRLVVGRVNRLAETVAGGEQLLFEFLF